jgi:hypothetical protein
MQSLLNWIEPFPPFPLSSWVSVLRGMNTLRRWEWEVESGSAWLLEMRARNSHFFSSFTENNK